MNKLIWGNINWIELNGELCWICYLVPKKTKTPHDVTNCDNVSFYTYGKKAFQHQHVHIFYIRQTLSCFLYICIYLFGNTSHFLGETHLWLLLFQLKLLFKVDSGSIPISASWFHGCWNVDTGVSSLGRTVQTDEFGVHEMLTEEELLL